MDVRSIEAKAPMVEHNGTVPVWWMIESREFKYITDGGYLELVNEFEVPGWGPGRSALPSHPRVLLRHVREGDHDDRRRGPAHLSGRPRLHPAGQGALAATDE